MKTEKTSVLKKQILQQTTGVGSPMATFLLSVIRSITMAITNLLQSNSASGDSLLRPASCESDRVSDPQMWKLAGRAPAGSRAFKRTPAILPRGDASLSHVSLRGFALSLLMAFAVSGSSLFAQQTFDFQVSTPFSAQPQTGLNQNMGFVTTSPAATGATVTIQSVPLGAVQFSLNPTGPFSNTISTSLNASGTGGWNSPFLYVSGVAGTWTLQATLTGATVPVTRTTSGTIQINPGPPAQFQYGYAVLATTGIVQTGGRDIVSNITCTTALPSFTMYLTDIAGNRTVSTANIVVTVNASTTGSIVPLPVATSVTITAGNSSATVPSYTGPISGSTGASFSVTLSTSPATYAPSTTSVGFTLGSPFAISFGTNITTAKYSNNYGTSAGVTAAIVNVTDYCGNTLTTTVTYSLQLAGSTVATATGTSGSRIVPPSTSNSISSTAYTIQAVSGVTSATSNPFQIDATQLSTSANQFTVCTGANFNLTVRFLDVNGSQISSTGTVTYTVNNGGSLSGSTTIPAVGGFATYTGQLIASTAGTYVVTATSTDATGTALTSTSFSLTVNVSSITLSVSTTHVVIGQNATYTANFLSCGNPIITSGNVFWYATDTFTNVKTQLAVANTAPVTSASPSIAWPASLNVVRNTGYIVTAEKVDNNGVTITSNGITVYPDINRLVYTSAPFTTGNCTNLASSANVTVQALDAGGSPVVPAIPSIGVAFSAGGPSLTGTPITFSGSSSTASASTLSFTNPPVAGTYTITASFTQLASVTGLTLTATSASTTLRIGSIAYLAPQNFAIGSTQNICSATSPTLTVALYDFCGNPIASNGNATFSINGGATINGATTQTAAFAGGTTATLVATINVSTVGTYTLTATAATLTGSPVAVSTVGTLRLAPTSIATITAASVTQSGLSLQNLGNPTFAFADNCGNYIITNSNMTLQFVTGANLIVGSLASATNATFTSSIVTSNTLGTTTAVIFNGARFYGATVGTYRIQASSVGALFTAGVTSQTQDIRVTNSQLSFVGSTPTTTSNIGCATQIYSNITVSFLDATGGSVNHTTQASLSIVSGPGAATLNGTTAAITTTATNTTTAVFSNVTFNASVAGSYTIQASANNFFTGAPTTTSFTVTVSNGTVAYVSSTNVLTIVNPSSANSQVIKTYPAITVRLSDGCTPPNALATNATVQLSVTGGGAINSGSSVITTTAVNGVATFANVQIRWNTAGTYTVTATAPTLSALGSTTFTEVVDVQRVVFANTNSAVTTCSVTTLPNFTVNLLDAVGTPVFASTTISMSVTATRNGGGTPATVSATPTAIVNQTTATFTGVTFNSANGFGNYIVSTATFSSPVTGATVASTNATQSPVDAVTTQFTSHTFPLTLTCGTVTTFTVQYRDVCGNNISTTGSVTINVVGGNFQLNGQTSISTTNVVNGLATFTNVYVSGTIGTYTMAAFASSPLTSNSINSFTNPVGSSSVTINFGTPVALRFNGIFESTSGSTITGTAGVNLTTTPIVNIVDACQNIVTSDILRGVSVVATSSSVTTTGVNVLPAAVNVTAIGATSYSGVNFTKAGQYRLYATVAPALTPALSTTITINPNIPTKVVIVSTNGTTKIPTLATAAIPFGQVQAQIQDAYDNIVTTASTTVSLSVLSGPTGYLPLQAASLNVAVVNGVATFTNPTLFTAGNYVLAANSNGLAGDNSNTITVQIGAPARLLVTTQPNSTVVSQTSLNNVVVAVTDNGSNVVPTYNGGTLTATLNVVTPGAATPFNAGTSTTFVNGYATVSNISVGIVGTYTVTLSTGGTNTFGTTTSSVFAVTPGTAASIRVVNPYTTVATAGQPLPSIPQVQFFDNVGNQTTYASTGTQTVTATANGGGFSVAPAAASFNASGTSQFTAMQFTQTTTTSWTVSYASPGLTGTSAQVGVLAAVPSKVVVVSNPASAQAGTAFNVGVQIRDAYDNLVNTTSQVTLTVQSGPSLTISSGSVNAVNGVATVPATLFTAGNYILSAESQGLASATTSTINVFANAPNKLVMVQQPSTSVVSLQAFTVSAQVQDAWNNVTSANVTFNATRGEGATVPPSTLGGTASQTLNTSTVTFNTLTLDKIGSNYTITISSPSIPNSTTSNVFAVTPGVAVSMRVVSSYTTIATAGVPLPTIPQVQLYDVSGNPTTYASSGSQTVTATANGGGFSVAPAAATFGGAGTSQFTAMQFTTTTTSTWTITYTSAGLTGTSAQVAVVPNSGNKVVVVSQPTSAQAGTAFNVGVQIRDAFDNLVNTNAQVTLSVLTGPSFSISAGTVNASAGVATIPATLTIAGNYTLTASGPGLASATTNTISVFANAANKLVMVQNPSTSIVSLQGFTVSAQVQDVYGNVTSANTTFTVARGFEGATVPPSTLGGTTSQSANTNLVTFTGLTIDKVGSAYTVVVGATGLTSTTSTAFQITPGAAASLRVTPAIQTVTAGQPFGSTPVVQLFDAGGNATNYGASSVTVAASGSGNYTVLTSATTTFNTSGQSQYTSMQFTVAGTYTLTFTSGALTQTVATITVVPNIPNKVVVASAPSTVFAGNTFNVTSQIQDAYNNVVTTATNAVSATVLTGPSTNVGNISANTVAGIAINGLQLYTAGTYVLNMNSSGLISGTTVTITVLPTTASRIVITTNPPANVTSMQPFTVAAQFLDAFGNITSTTTTVTATRTEGAVIAPSVLGGTTSQSVSAASTVSFSNLTIDKVGTQYTVILSATGLTSTTSTQFAVNTGAPARLAMINNFSTLTAGVAADVSQTPFIQIQDAGGNPVSSSPVADNNLSDIANENIRVVVVSHTPGLYGTTTVGANTVIVTAATLTSINGQGQFTLGSFVLNTAGTYTIRAEHANVDGGTTFAASSNATLVVFPNVAVANNSTVVANPVSGSSLVVGGQSFGVLTAPTTRTANLLVSAFDAFGNRSTSGTISFSATNSLAVGNSDVTVSSVTLSGSTQATTNFRTGTTANVTANVTASVGGSQIGSTVAYVQVADVITNASIMAANSTTTIVVGGIAINDATRRTGITVTARDQFNNPSTNGSVTLTASGSIGVVGGLTTATTGGNTTLVISYSNATSPTDNVRTVNYTSGLFVGGITVSGAANGTISGSPISILQVADVATTATVAFVGGGTTSQAIVGGANGVSSANGRTSTSISISVFDQFGNAATTGSVTLTIPANSGSLNTAGSVVSTTQTVSGTNALTSTFFTGTTGTHRLAGGTPVNVTVAVGSTTYTLTVQQYAGPAVASQSTIATSTLQLQANPAAQATITMTLRDQYGNLTSTSGTFFGLGAASAQMTLNGQGSLNPAPSSNLVESANGVVTTVFSAGTVAISTSNITGLIGGATVGTVSITQFPGSVSVAQSTITSNTTTMVAGQTGALLTITLRDAFGNVVRPDLLPGGSTTISVQLVSGNVGSPALTGGSGTATNQFVAFVTPSNVNTLTFNAGTQSGVTYTINAFSGSQAFATPVVINSIAGPAASTQSTLTGLNTSMVVNTTRNFVVTLRDQFGNLTTNGTVALSAQNGTLSTTSVSGVTSQTVTFTASTTAGQVAQIAAQIGGTNINGSTIFFLLTPDVATVTRSTFTVTNTVLSVGNASTASVAVQLRDAYGNNTNVLSTTFTVTAPSFGTLTPSLNVVDASGATSGTFSIGNISVTSGQMTATLGGVNIVNSPVTITVVTGAATRVELVTAPGTTTGGLPLNPQPVVRILDAGNNLVTGYVGTVNTTVLSGPASGSIMSGASATVVNGVATFSNQRLNRAGLYTLQFATGSLTATTASVQINVGPAAQLVFTGAFAIGNSTNALAGQNFAPITVQSVDLGGNVTNNTDGSLVTLALNGGTPGAILTALQGQLANGTAVISTASINTAGTGYFLSASNSGFPYALTSGTSGTITINPAPAVGLAFFVQPPAVVTSQTGFTVTVRTVDQFGNYAVPASPVSIVLTKGTDPSGVATLAVNGSSAIVDRTITVSNGVATFANVTLDKVGSGYTLFASAQGYTTGESNGFNVVAGAPVRLVFTTDPATLNSGVYTAATPFAPQPAVAVQDAGGNTVTTGAFANTTATVAISFRQGGNSASGILSGTTTLTLTNGVGTFSGLRIDKIGQYRLTATATGLTQATTGAINITAGPVAQLGFSVQPGNGVAGQLINTMPTVVLQDAGGNLVNDGNNRAVTLTVNGTTFSAIDLNPKTTFAGQVDFTGIRITTAGTYTLTAAATGLTSGISSSFVISPAAPSQARISAHPTGSVVAGTTVGNVTVNVFDAFGNVANNTTLTVNLSFNGVYAGTTTQVTTTGVATFSGMVVTTAGVGYNFGATVVGVATVSTTSTFNVVAAAPAIARYNTHPTGQYVAGTAITNANVTASIFDIFGNVANNTSVSVTMTMTGGATTTFSGTTSTTSVTTTGSVSFTGMTVNTASTVYRFALNVAGIGSITTTASFDVVPAAPATMTVVNKPVATQVAGVNFTIVPVVTLFDAFGNIATNATGTVTFGAWDNNAGGYRSFNSTSTATSATAVGFAGATTSNIVNGVATMATNNNLQIVGNSYEIDAYLTANPAVNNLIATPFAVVPAAASRIVYTAQPVNGSNYVAGTTIATFSTQLFDQFGNVATNTTGNVTLAINPVVTMNGSQTTAVVNAVATFANLSVNQAGSYTVTASFGTLSTTSNLFNIIPAAAANVAIVTSPTGTFVADPTALPQTVVRLTDAFGNLVVNSTTVTIRSIPANSFAAGSVVTVASVGALATFANVDVTTVGNNYSVAVDLLSGTGSVLNTAVTTATFNIIGGVATRVDVLSVTDLLTNTTTPAPLAVASRNLPFGVRLGLRDQYGNVTTTNGLTFTATGTAVPTTTSTVVFASGSTSAVSSNITPTVAGTNLTVTLTSGGLSTTLSINVVYDIMSFTYVTNNSLTRFYPAFIAPTIGGGRPPFNFALLNGANAPAGMTFNATTGTFSGTPTATQAPFSYTVIGTDANGQVNYSTVVISVSDVLTISYNTTQTLFVGNSVSIAPTAVVGGVQPITFAVTSGTLPAGLVLNSTNGLITGTPTTAQTVTVIVRAVDANGSIANSPIFFTVSTQAVVNPTVIDLTVWLQAGQTTNGNATMNTNLRNNTSYGNMLPSNFSGVSSQFGVNGISVSGVVTTSSIATNIVDWLVVELRNPSNANASVVSVAALLRNDGKVVGLSSADQAAGVLSINPSLAQAGQYYAVVRHRNHLRVRTNGLVTAVVGGQTTVNYDLTAAGAAYVRPGNSGSDARVLMSNGRWAMYAGNANDLAQEGTEDGITAGDRSAVINAILSNVSGVYSRADLNLDGEVTTSDLATTTNNVNRLTQDMP